MHLHKKQGLSASKRCFEFSTAVDQQLIPADCSLGTDDALAKQLTVLNAKNQQLQSAIEAQAQMLERFAPRQALANASPDAGRSGADSPANGVPRIAYKVSTPLDEKSVGSAQTEDRHAETIAGLTARVQELEALTAQQAKEQEELQHLAESEAQEKQRLQEECAQVASSLETKRADLLPLVGSCSKRSGKLQMSLQN